MARNNFTIEEVKKHWDAVADIYDDTNQEIGDAYYQRFKEGLRHLELHPGEKILNIWSRTGNAIPWLEKYNVEIYNLEVSPKMIKKAENKFTKQNFQLTNLEQINFPDNYFDAILSLETLEHTPDPSKLLNEFYRILKPEKIAVISLPPQTAEIPLRIYEFFFQNHGEGPHKFLTSKTVKSLIANAGFELLLHKGTLLIPTGPKLLQKFGELIINKLQKTFIKEFGIRQFYICQKKP
jgi:ubiquinone/menaquinone biosynthesis C-methylase UbiE